MEQTKPLMLRITAPHFVAGIIRGGPCAPILSYMRGWTLSEIEKYARSKGWTVERMP